MWSKHINLVMGYITYTINWIKKKKNVGKSAN